MLQIKLIICLHHSKYIKIVFNFKSKHYFELIKLSFPKRTKHSIPKEITNTKVFLNIIVMRVMKFKPFREPFIDDWNSI